LPLTAAVEKNKSELILAYAKLYCRPQTVVWTEKITWLNQFYIKNTHIKKPKVSCQIPDVQECGHISALTRVSKCVTVVSKLLEKKILLNSFFLKFFRS